MPSLNVKTKTRLHQRAEWFALRYFCDHVISVSEEARRYHMEISHTSPDQVTTIYNGIDLSAFLTIDYAYERNAVRAELGIPRDANILITVAVLRPAKGIQFMIRALPAILASHPNTCYLIVGDGPHHNTLVQEVEKTGVKKRVIFAGMRKDVPRLLAVSDVFVLPTLTEALPTVLAEAMAARLPIVASRVGGIPEMIANGQNGFLVTPEDLDGFARACNHLLAHPEKRADMGAEGWKMVRQKFSIDRQVEQLKELYFEQLHAYGKS
jgi:glycosyltransferase involved in cell wall biosynthesis